MTTSSRRLRLDWFGDGWSGAWNRDDPFHGTDERAYADLHTGKLCWEVPDSDIGLTDEQRAAVAAGLLVEIPPPDHGEHHVIYRAWLNSLPPEVSGPINTASIGGGLRDAEAHFPEMGLRDEWHSFHEVGLIKLATQWLAERGVDVEWSDYPEDEEA